MQILRVQGRQEFHHPVGLVQIQPARVKQAAAVIHNVFEPGLQGGGGFLQGGFGGGLRLPVGDEPLYVRPGSRAVETPEQMAREQCQAGLALALRVHLDEQRAPGAGQACFVQVPRTVFVQGVAHRVGPPGEGRLEAAVMNVVFLQDDRLGQDVEQVSDDDGEGLHVFLRHPVRVYAIYLHGAEQRPRVRQHEPPVGAKRAMIDVDWFSVHSDVRSHCCPRSRQVRRAPRDRGGSSPFA